MKHALPHRRTRPRLARMGIGVAVFFLVVAVYGPAPSIRAAVAGASRAAVRIASSHQPIIARAFLFNVPFRRQQHALSCEVASLRTALAGIGIDVSERDLWLQLAKDPTKKRVTSAGIIWGDPNEGFVGNIDGRMPSTGYGVFSGPILDVAKLYASSTLIRVDSGRAIDAALSARHPVIVWTVIGKRTSELVWKTPAGKTVTAPVYEHTAVIVGYRGTADAVEGVYLVDPLTSLRYEPWDEFIRRTKPFGHVGIEVGNW